MNDLEAQALQRVIEGRIRELWVRRRWYQQHAGWIVQSYIEDMHELRQLVRLARGARKAARLAQQHREREERRLYESWRDPHMAEPWTNREGMPEFNGAFR